MPIIEILHYNAVKVYDTELTLTDIDNLAKVAKEIRFWREQLDLYVNPDQSLYEEIETAQYNFRLEIDLNYYEYQGNQIYSNTVLDLPIFEELKNKKRSISDSYESCMIFCHPNEKVIQKLEKILKSQIIYPTLLKWNEVLKVWDDSEIEKIKNFILGQYENQSH